MTLARVMIWGASILPYINYTSKLLTANRQKRQFYKKFNAFEGGSGVKVRKMMKKRRSLHKNDAF
jgi:hypothetical protein